MVLVYGISDKQHHWRRIGNSAYTLSFFKSALRNNQLMIDELDFKYDLFKKNIYQSTDEIEIYRSKANNKIYVLMDKNKIYGEKEIYEVMKEVIIKNGHDPKQTHLNIAIEYVDKNYVKEFNIDMFQ